MPSFTVASKFDAAGRAPLSIENVPSMEFEDKRLEFINAARAELGLMES